MSYTQKATALRTMFKRKPEDEPDTPTTPAPRLMEPETKKFRSAYSEVDGKVQIVARAVNATPGRLEPCRQMLASMCAGSLGPAHPERDEFQTESVDMIGRALRLIEDSIMKALQELEMHLSQAKAVVEGFEAKQSLLDENLRQAQDATSQKGKAVADAKAACDEALQQKRTAKTNLTKAEADMAAATRDKQMVESLYNNHFLPLMNGNVTDLADANGHLDTLRGPLQSWRCEDCLFAGFCESARHSPSERKDWCSRVMTGIDEFFQKPLQDAEAKFRAAKEVVEQCRRELQVAEALCAERDEAHQRAVEELQRARIYENKCADELNALRKELNAAIYAVKEANRKLDEKKAELKGFQDGPLDAYRWLKENTIKGQYDTVNQVKQFYKHDPDVSDKVKLITDALERYALQTVPCKDMLSSMVPGSLGPAKNEREEFQDESVEMIGRALQMIISELERQILDLETKLQKATEVRAGVELRKDHALKELENARSVVAMKSKLANDAKTALDDASKDRMICKQNVSTGDGKFREAEGERAWREDLYKNHFMILKNGHFSSIAEANSHLDVLRHPLQKWGIEDCLLAAFSEAARKYPKDRGEWCARTVDGVDDFFKFPLQDVEVKWRECKEELEGRRRDLQGAEDSLTKAQANHQLALQELQAARAAETECGRVLSTIETELRAAIAQEKDVSSKLEAKKRELSQFMAIVFEAYKLLKARTK